MSKKDEQNHDQKKTKPKITNNCLHNTTVT